MPLLIVGASARAAAWSAARAGYAPVAVDAFADLDLVEAARVLPVERFPDDVAAAVEALPPMPWMYTGGFENHPSLIEAVSRRHRLLGNPPQVLREVRDPELEYEALTAAGLPALEVRLGGRADRLDAMPPPDGRWLLKPLRSAGGRGIREWTGASRREATLNEPHYFQRRAAGVPHSALFLAQAETAMLIGACRQWVGWKSVSAPEFAWCGGMGPVRLPEVVEQQVRRMGNVLAQRFKLRGLFGIDLIVDDHTAWLTEVNPRYTGSVEIFERALGLPLLRLHQKACESDSPVRTVAIHGFVRVVGKVIQYAPADLVFPVVSQLVDAPAAIFDRRYADLPRPGTTIPGRHPVCTVLAAGRTPSQCARRLGQRLVRLQRKAGIPTGIEPELVLPGG